MSKWIDRDIFPETDEIFSWIQHLASMGHRRSGTPENRRSAEYIQNRFTKFGLRNVLIENQPAVFYFPEAWSLSVGKKEIPSYFINYTFAGSEIGTIDTGDLETEMVYVGDGTKEDFKNVDVKGKIVLSNIRWNDYTLEYFKTMSSSECYWYDPRGTVRDESYVFHKDTYTPNTFPINYFNAVANGAAGFVCIMVDNCDHYIHYCENYINEFKTHPEYGAYVNMPIPGLWISRSSGRELTELLKNSSGQVKATINMRTTTRKGVTNIVYGVLPGKTDEIVLIHSHHDAVYQGAVQDASGMSAVLAVAKYFGQIPEEKREKTLMFAAMDSHFSGYSGHMGFIDNRRKSGDRMIIDFAIEHIGKEAVQNNNGGMSLSGEVGMRLLYVTENKNLLDISTEAVVENNLERTYILPVTREAGNVCSDGFQFWKHGYPVVSMISPVIYLMDPIDTPDMVAVDQLRPVSMAVAEMVVRASMLKSEDLRETKDLHYFHESPLKGRIKG
jgi:hypothetical protein